MRVVRVRLGKRSYSVRIVRGGLGGVGRFIGRTHAGARCAVLSDTNVAPLYADSVRSALQASGLPSELLVFPAGERAKRVKSLQRTWEWLMHHGFDRGNTLVVALGGGVIGDLAGFAAATYMRGVRYVHVPTSLLAQVDSSVGGKTAINLPGAKNVVGSFHQPSLVYASLGTLTTLPTREYRCGLAEVLKHGVIRRPAILDMISEQVPAVVQRDPGLLEALVSQSCEVKRDVVERDEREAGERQVLNFGHTFGHAIEVASGHRKRHGEAVALGMLAACRVSEGLGLCDSSLRQSLTDCMKRIGLDTNLEPWWRPDLVAHMAKDKKMRDGSVNFITIERFGHVAIRPIPLDTLTRLVRRGVE